MSRDYKASKVAILAAEAKEILLREISLGKTVVQACETISRSPKTYENWRATDPEFLRRLDEIRYNRNFIKKTGVSPDNVKMSFEAWRKKFLNRETYPHQRMWIDILEGRQPTDLHPSMVYEPNKPNRILINTPPFHAKSTILTQEYVVYRICMKPTTRVCIVSKTQAKAKKFLFQ